YLRCISLSHTPEKKTEHGCLACHDLSRIDFDVSSTPDHNYSPAMGKHSQIVSKVYVRQHLDDHIDPASVRYVENQLLIIRRAVVDRLMRTLFLHQLQAFVTSCCTDRLYTRPAREP